MLVASDEPAFKASTSHRSLLCIRKGAPDSSRECKKGINVIMGTCADDRVALIFTDINIDTLVYILLWALKIVQFQYWISSLWE